MSNAPVCHIPPKQPTDNRQPLNIPAIPLAQPNLQSLTDTVNRMRAAIMMLTGQSGSAGQNAFSGAFRTKQDDSKKVQWVEQGRVTENVRIFQNNDKTSDNWVDVERLNQLTMHDKNTGQVWRWDRERS